MLHACLEQYKQCSVIPYDMINCSLKYFLYMAAELSFIKLLCCIHTAISDHHKNVQHNFATLQNFCFLLKVGLFYTLNLNIESQIVKQMMWESGGGVIDVGSMHVDTIIFNPVLFFF